MPASHRGNSIDFLRLFLAVMVAAGHCYPLGGFVPGMLGSALGVPLFPRYAVCGFFFLSGFLITGSYVGSASTLRYLWHRFLRIFPGFWCCLLVMAFVFGPIAAVKEGLPVADYFDPVKEQGPFQYLGANVFLWIGQYPIRGLLARLPFPSSVDGSLWTLYTEFQCYLFVAAVGAFGAFRSRRFLLVTTLIVVLALDCYPPLRDVRGFDVVYDRIFFHEPLRVQQWAFFLVGSAACLWRESLPLNRSMFVVATSLTLLGLSISYFIADRPFAAARYAGYLGVAMPFVLSYSLLWMAFCLPFSNFGRHGDISYGFYLYAFPIQQGLSLFHMNAWGILPYFLLTVTTCSAIGTASWILVERPSLSLKGTSFSRFTPWAAARDITRAWRRS